MLQKRLSELVGSVGGARLWRWKPRAAAPGRFQRTAPGCNAQRRRVGLDLLTTRQWWSGERRGRVARGSTPVGSRGRGRGDTASPPPSVQWQKASQTAITSFNAFMADLWEPRHLAEGCMVIRRPDVTRAFFAPRRRGGQPTASGYGQRCIDASDTAACAYDLRDAGRVARFGSSP